MSTPEDPELVKITSIALLLAKFGTFSDEVAKLYNTISEPKYIHTKKIDQPYTWTLNKLTHANNNTCNNVALKFAVQIPLDWPQGDVANYAAFQILADFAVIFKFIAKLLGKTDDDTVDLTNAQIGQIELNCDEINELQSTANIELANRINTLSDGKVEVLIDAFKKVQATQAPRQSKTHAAAPAAPANQTPKNNNGGDPERIAAIGAVRAWRQHTLDAI